MANIVKHGDNTIKAHLEHLKEHNETKFFNQAIGYLKENNIENPLKNQDNSPSKDNLPCGCPGTQMREIKTDTNNQTSNNTNQKSTLTQWPVQLTLLPPQAPFFNNSNLLIAADCVPFADANFHSDFLK